MRKWQKFYKRKLFINRNNIINTANMNLNNYMYSHLALLRKSCAKTVPSLVAWMDLCSLDVPLSIRSPFRSIRGGRSHFKEVKGGGGGGGGGRERERISMNKAKK